MDKYKIEKIEIENEIERTPEILHNYKINAVDKDCYEFLINYAIQLTNPKKLTNTEKYEDYRKNFAKMILTHCNQISSPDLKIVEVENKLVSLISNTNNDTFYRPLFHRRIFINVDIPFEDLIIKGIYVEDNDQSEYSENYFKKHNKTKKDLSFVSIAVHPQECVEFFTNASLVNDVIIKGFHENVKEHNKIIKMNKFIRNIICNIIDMIDNHDEELEYINVKTTIEQNIKRVKRGKHPRPNNKIYIRTLDGSNLQKHVKNFNDDSNNNENIHNKSWIVRGHWYHFKHEKFKERIGDRVWKKPYIKGKGILVNKNIKLT